MESTLTSGAPSRESHWLVSLLAALEQQNANYQTRPIGLASLGRATIKFTWDDRNSQFYAKLVDTVPGTGCIGGDVVTGIDPQTQTVNQAAAKVHERILQFLRNVTM